MNIIAYLYTVVNILSLYPTQVEKGEVEKRHKEDRGCIKQIPLIVLSLYFDAITKLFLLHLNYPGICVSAIPPSEKEVEIMAKSKVCINQLHHNQLPCTVFRSMNVLLSNFTEYMC